MTNFKRIMLFLSDLAENNNKEWYHLHTSERKEAESEFEFFVEDLENQILKFDKSISYYPPQKLTFKQVRDTRFSKEKSLYNPVFRAHIAPNGKVPIPVGYYICLGANNRSFIGGGLFTDMFSDATHKIRDYIYEHTEEFNKIISDKVFKENFIVMGKKLKNVPKAYNLNSLAAEYLKNKSWYLEYRITDKEVTDNENITDIIIEKFKIMKEFNDFLNLALVNFKMPERK